MTPGFGNNEEKVGFIERFVRDGKYVNVYIQGRAETFSGRAKSLEDGYLILNPFTGADWDVESGMTRKLIYEDSGARVSDITAIEPLSRANVENFLKYQNKQNESNNQSSNSK
jgi:hypothetical protein